MIYQHLICKVMLVLCSCANTKSPHESSLHASSDGRQLSQSIASIQAGQTKWLLTPPSPKTHTHTHFPFYSVLSLCWGKTLKSHSDYAIPFSWPHLYPTPTSVMGWECSWSSTWDTFCSTVIWQVLKESCSPPNSSPHSPVCFSLKFLNRG